MSDTSLFLWINGLAGQVAVLDEFFKGIANDYFALICTCLIMIWLWFAPRDSLYKEMNQRAVMASLISIGTVGVFMALCNYFYFRPRPFDALASGSVNLLFYKPTDSSFPSNFAAVIFAITTPIFVKNKKFGSLLLVLAFLSSFGRIYIGVHYPMDVLGGMAIGVLAGIIALGLSHSLRPVLDYLLATLRRIYLA